MPCPCERFCEAHRGVLDASSRAGAHCVSVELLPVVDEGYAGQEEPHSFSRFTQTRSMFNSGKRGLPSTN
jgi:hypothetical protein